MRLLTAIKISIQQGNKNNFLSSLCEVKNKEGLN
jgi:hypothetical protein